MLEFLSLVSGLLLAASLRTGLRSIGFVDAISLSSSGSSVSLDGIPYFISPYSSGTLSLEGLDLSTSTSVGGLYPVTLLSDVTAESNISVLMETFLAEDDVFQAGFMQSTFFRIASWRSPYFVLFPVGLAVA